MLLCAAMTNVFADNLVSATLGSDADLFNLALRQQRFDMFFAQQALATQMDQVELMYLEKPLVSVQAGIIAGKSFIAQNENTITQFGELSGYYGGVLVRIAHRVAERFALGVEGRYAYFDINDSLDSRQGIVLHQWQGQGQVSLALSKSVAFYLGERMQWISGTLVSASPTATSALIDKAFYRAHGVGLEWQVEPGGFVGLEWGTHSVSTVELFFQRRY